jgi:outer membrane biosynthesis protein TonB
MPKTVQPKQPKAALKAKPGNKGVQPAHSPAPTGRPKGKLQPTNQPRPKARPAPAVQPAPRAKSKPAVQSKPKSPTPDKTPVKAAPAAEQTPTGKLGILVQMLKRPQGASVYDLADAVGWNTNSIRGAMAGALKARGYVVTSEKPNAIRIYSLVSPAKAFRQGDRR